MNRKGVCYDVGREMMGSKWRPHFDAQIVHRELGIIKKDMHCNAVRIQGLDIGRLMTAAEDALQQGLEVWLSPEMWDKGEEETIDYLVKAATAAESLRRGHPDLVLSVGSESTLFMMDIAEGNNVFERIFNPSFWENVKLGRFNGPLNTFLAKANKAVRRVFHGKVTYFSVPFERVDWSMFDFVGLDLYRDERIREAYGGMVKSYLAYGKPVLIGEFGCCTYKGAEKLGGMGFIAMFGMMTDHLDRKPGLPKGISDIIKIPTQVDGHYVRDESLQAREISDQLRVLDLAGVDGAFVFSFIVPTSPYNEDPRFDGDMASYSLVKSFAEEESIAEIIVETARQGEKILGVEIDPRIIARFMGPVGKHGTTYPDMPWEPKESFRAVADYYANH